MAMTQKTGHRCLDYTMLWRFCCRFLEICICLILIQWYDFFWHCLPRKISRVCCDWLFTELSSIFQRNFAMLVCSLQHNLKIARGSTEEHHHLLSLPRYFSFCWRIMHLFAHLELLWHTLLINVCSWNLANWCN